MNQKQTGQKQRIAILGGGIAGLSTALFLTEDRDWKEKFEDITVFQMGWRLGGKCATGRGPARRIQEHGIHLFGGGYYNALRMMWNCYEELCGSAAGWPFSFEDAFTPHYTAASLEGIPGKRRPHLTTFPKSRRGPSQAEGLDTVGAWLWQIADIVLEALISRLESDAQSLMRQPGGAPASRLQTISDSIQKVKDFRRSFKDTVYAPAPGAYTRSGSSSNDAPDQLERAKESAFGALDELAEQFSSALGTSRHEKQFSSALGTSRHELRFLIALLLGTLRDVSWEEKTFAELDKQSYAEWLRDWGADDGARSCGIALAPIRILYQYPKGDPRPQTGNMGAGGYIQWSLRSFAYLTAPFWHFAQGTGESVVLPIYELLRRRGVKFEFFHQVTKLSVAAGDGTLPRIASVELQVQATPKDPRAGYQPLLDATNPGGLPCWPAEPLFDQLEQGEDLKKLPPDTLESAWSEWKGVRTRTLSARQGMESTQAGEDTFDKVVLAISIGAHKALCEALLKKDRRWRQMVAKIPTVETHSLQVWLSEPSPRLLSEPALRAAGVQTVQGCGLAHPFDGFADLSHLLAREAWPRGVGSGPRSLWYFSDIMANSPATAPTTDASYPDTRAKEALTASRAFVNGPLLELFDRDKAGVPDPSGGGGRVFKDALLVAPPGSTQPSPASPGEPLVHQWVRANIQPSDRYVQAPVGSTQFRLKAGNTGFTNLVVSGDWAYTGLNVGCVESAVMSGHLAANAILGRVEGQGLIGYFP